MKKSNIIIWVLVILGILLAILGGFQLNKKFSREELVNSSDNFNTPNTQIANPASVNCINLGGELEIRKDEEKNEYGVCIREGKECEEWELFRGECTL